MGIFLTWQRGKYLVTFQSGLISSPLVLDLICGERRVIEIHEREAQRLVQQMDLFIVDVSVLLSQSQIETDYPLF